MGKARIGALGCLVLAAGQPAAAIGYFGTTAGVIDGTLINPCTSTNAIDVTISCIRSGSQGQFFQAFARAEPKGSFRGQAFARGFGDQTTVTIGTGSGAWTERITFTTLEEPVFARFTIQMSGSQSSFFDGSGMVGARTEAFMRMGVYRGGLSADPAVLDEILLVRRLADSGSFQVHSLGREETVRGVSGGFTSISVAPDDTVFTFDLTAELDPGLELIDFVWRFAANAEVAAGANAFAFADYGATFRILDIAFLNAAGRNIGHTLNIRFPSGNVWPVSFVPEPGTWALLVAGFGLVGGALRRHRCAAVDRAPALA